MNDAPPCLDPKIAAAASGAPIQIGRARPEDVEAIFQMIDASSKKTRVLPRTRESILQRLAGFRIATEGERIVACGALHWASPHLAEVRSVVVDDSARGKGLGARIVRELIEDARRQGGRRVFTLTDVTEFFRRQGFALTDRQTLPEKVWNDCVLCPKFNDCVEVAMDMTLDQPE